MKNKLIFFALLLILGAIVFVQVIEKQEVETKDMWAGYNDIEYVFQAKSKLYAGLIEIEKNSPNAILFYKLNKDNLVSEVQWNICQVISQEHIDLLSSISSLQKIHNIYINGNKKLDYSKIYESKQIIAISYFSENSNLILKKPFVRSDLQKKPL